MDRNCLKWRRLSFLLATVCLMICIMPECRMYAASASLGSIRADGFDEEKRTVLLEKLGFTDREEEFGEKFDASAWKKNFTKKELRLMSALIFAEANGMDFDAKVAVANAVLNRMRDGLDGEEKYGYGYVTTIEEVIYDHKWGYQFSPVKDGSLDKALKIYDNMDPDVWKDWQIRAMSECIEAAKAALAGWKTIPDSFLYFNSHLEKQSRSCLENGWSFSIIERHIYYNKLSEN